MQEALEYSQEINGVPHFIFDNKFSVNGAQDSATFENILKKLANKEV